MLQYINQSPNLDWNKEGELLIKNQSIPSSHISDLVKDSITEYNHFEPAGVTEFYQNLGNIPQTIITNPKRRRLIQKGGQSIPPPPGQPEETKTRVLKTVKPVKRLKPTWKDMWKTL